MQTIDSVPSTNAGRDLLQDIAGKLGVRMTHRLTNQKLKDAIKREGVFSFAEDRGLSLFNAKGEAWVREE